MACSRDCKKTGLAALASIVLLTPLEFVIHDVLLKGVYARPHYQSLWNPPSVMGSRIGLAFLGNLLFCAAFTLIYTRGYEDAKPPLGQGLRYGLLAGLAVFPYHSLTNYMVYPVSLKLALAWIVAGVAECLILGAAVAAIYRPAPETAHTH